MLYPKNLEQKIGFDKIRLMLNEHCESVLGQRFVEKVKFSNQKSTIDKWLEQTKEFLRIIESGDLFPNSNYIDFSGFLKKAQVENSFLSEEEFYDLILALKTVDLLMQFFREKGEEYPALASLTEPVQFDDNLYWRLADNFDERGKLKDNASADLLAFRLGIEREQRRLRKVLDGILKNARKDELTPDDISITIRDGRMVIPVLAEHKRRIKGFIHGESATGQTVYIEPAEVLEINNEVKELEYAERREVVRILTELTDQIRPEIENYEGILKLLGLIDFIRSKARFASRIDGTKPNWNSKKGFKWVYARHPILLLTHQELDKEVVPLNIELGGNHRILVISGPNAGGKSVCLKTVGLLQYMFQCGLLVPVDEKSEFGLFKDLFIDIGDEQSIENDLSTYSSHLVNMKALLGHVSKQSLFLIDEFGTGTEPQFGGAIAEAILDELNHSKGMGVVTTHYGNLKEFADRENGLVNGAMKYDLEKLSPLYELELGKPGSSFALEIAQKIGLPRKTLSEAKKKVGVKKVSLDRLIAKLDHQKTEVDRIHKSVKLKEKELEETSKQYEELKEHLHLREKQILNKAKSEAAQLVKDANARIEKIIREIRESKAAKEKVKSLRSDLEAFKSEKLKTEKPKVKAQKEKVVSGPINLGDHVRIKDQETIGQVIGIKGKDVELSIGSLKTKVKLTRLEKVTRSERKEAAKSSKPKGVSLNDKMARFSHQLDIRGLRAEEVHGRLDQYMDEAIMLGANELHILHGKGNGVLREIVRQHLKGYKEVEGARDEHADRGGAGVTIVTMK